MAWIAATAILATSTYLQYDQNKKAVEDQKEANRTRGRLQDIQARRERARAVQEQRVIAARMIASEASSGAATSSTAGSVASTQSQLGTNLGFLSSSQAAQSNIFKNEQRAQDHANRGQLYGQLGQSALQIYGYSQ